MSCHVVQSHHSLQSVAITPRMNHWERHMSVQLHRTGRVVLLHALASVRRYMWVGDVPMLVLYQRA